MPLNEFHVTFKEDEQARFVRIGKQSSALSEWALYNLDISPAYAAAIAYRGMPRQVVRSPLLPAMLQLD